MWVGVEIQADRSESGKVSQWRMVLVDITKKKEAEKILQEYSAQLKLQVRNRTAEIEAQYKELEKLNAIIRHHSRISIEAIEKDRKVFSREIHDSIGGSLAAIKMLLEARLRHSDELPSEGIMPLEKIIDYLADCIKESKRISCQLRTQALDDFGMVAAIHDIILKYKELYPKLEIDFRSNISNNHLHDVIETVVYRVVQEALNNIGKHSGADVAKIELVETQDQILLKVEDNGCGFNATNTLDTNQSLRGYGMLSMQERVEICNGIFEVKSEPGKGTFLVASIPKSLL